MPVDEPQGPENQNSNQSAPQDLLSEISVSETKALMDSGAPMILVDCRELREQSIAQIEGSVLIPMDEIPGRISELEEFRGERIVIHCHHGGRSLQVVNWLRNHGFETAQNMTGGIEMWSQEIDSDVARY